MSDTIENAMDFVPDSEPTLYEAVWDGERLQQLLADLKQAAVIQHVQVRTDIDGVRGDRTTTLEEAEALYHAGQATAIQVRYGFDGQQWCDTVMIDGDTARIIRTRIP